MWIYSPISWLARDWPLPVLDQTDPFPWHQREFLLPNTSRAGDQPSVDQVVQRKDVRTQNTVFVPACLRFSLPQSSISYKSCSMSTQCLGVTPPDTHVQSNVIYDGHVVRWEGIYGRVKNEATFHQRNQNPVNYHGRHLENATGSWNTTLAGDIMQLFWI